MDFFHCPIKIISRNKGKSAVAAAAYRSGTKLVNTWDGVTHDYTRKQHIIHSEIMLPTNAPQSYLDRSTLWNSVEWSESDRNAQLARDIELALPAELTHAQQIQLVRQFVKKTFVNQGMCADFSIHDKKDGNPHAHILLTMRAIQDDDTWAPKSRLEYVLDENGQRIPAKQKGRWKTRKIDFVDWNDRGNAEKWRAAAADAINEALREAGFKDGFVDHRSYKRQGIAQTPMIHEGPEVRAMERKGIRTEIGDANRAIRDWNKQAAQIEARLVKLKGWLRYKMKLDELKADNNAAPMSPALESRLFDLMFQESMKQAGSNKQKVRRLKDAMGMRNIMHDYDIHDAASFLAASNRIDQEFYKFRHDLRENDQATHLIDERLDALTQHRKYKPLYQQYMKLPKRKQDTFYEEHRAELISFEAADKKLTAWQQSDEDLNKRHLTESRANLSQKRFVLEFDLKGIQEKTHHMEVGKHAFIEDEKLRTPRNKQKTQDAQVL